MASAIFLRAANVGGNNVFSPKEFVAQHPELQLTNIGHAGTFVSKSDAPDLAAAVAAALSIGLPMAIVDQAEVQDLVKTPPEVPEGAKAEVTVFLEDGDAPSQQAWPEAGEWEIRLQAATPWCAVTLRQPGGRLSPYKVLEAATGRPGTTRSWGVMEKVAKA